MTTIERETRSWMRTGWLVAAASALVAVGWAARASAMDDAAKARARLAEIVAIEDDDDFLLACGKLLAEHGVEPAIVFGDRHVVGSGFDLMTKASKGPDWVLRDGDEREVRIKKGRFVKFLSRGRVLDAAPTDADEVAAGHVFIGLDDTASFVSMKTGRAKRLNSAP